MSLIYEALRKSEAERRRGETPSLIGESIWAQRPRIPTQRGPAWRWLAVGAALLIGGAAAAWWLGRESARQSVAAPAAESSAPAAIIDSVPTVPADTLAVAPEEGSNPTQAPAPDSAPAAVPNAAPPTAETAVPPPVPPAPLASAPLVSQPESAPPAPVPQDEPAVPDTIPAPAPEAIPVAAAPTEPALTQWWELPAATRQTLPPLKLAMHVFSPDPSRRFVLIGETRLAEGDAVGGEVVLREIRADGVVFELRGQRFFVPR
jgi:general secretion pathway protein B